MYVIVADKLSCTSNTGDYSQAVSMEGANAVLLTLLVHTKSASTTVDASLEGSNDLQNWSNSGLTGSTSLTATTIGFAAPLKVTGIAYRYIRVKFTVSPSTVAIVSSDVNTASL
ncbi:MAG: hypothetical protein IPN34_21025 [Planctomycetes bacterium]|nr:hypothetical protein [Planctomycetota bacterium]